MAGTGSVIDTIKTTGEVPAEITAQAGLAMAYAGRDWDKYKKDHGLNKPDGTFDKDKAVTEEMRQGMEKLAHQSLRETPLAVKDKDGKPQAYDPKKPTMLDAQIDSYIQRSYDMDKTDGLKQGTHLSRFLEGVSTANHSKDINLTEKDFEKLDSIDFSKVDPKNPIAGLMTLKPDERTFILGMQGKLKPLAEAYHTAADHDVQHGIQDFNKDLVATIKADDQPQQPGQPAKKKQFDGVADDALQATGGPGGGIMMLIMMFIGALLGIDIGSLFGGGKEKEDKQKEIENKAGAQGISFLNDINPALKRMQTGTATETDVQAVENFAGISSDKRVGPLSADQQKALGGELQGRIGGDIAKGTQEGDISADVRLNWDDIVKKAGTMPKAVSTGPDHGNAPGGTNGGGPAATVPQAGKGAAQGGGR